MNGIILMGGSIIILALAYILYGKWLERTWGVDPKKETPAHTLQDGVDYVPAKKNVLFGHQFSSIAGAGPINGPIIAAMFGWLPVLLWVLVGGIFIGAVHDFGALYASVKNEGKSMGYLIEMYIGKSGKIFFLLFVWLLSILVIAAFANIVAGTFSGMTLSSSGETVMNYSNAATASTSIMFVLAALLLGVFVYFKKPNAIVSTVVAVVLIIICLAVGMTYPIYLSETTWLYVVFLYIFVASVTPIWILLQPRDYLCSFLLLAMMAAAFVGIIVANPTIQLPAYSGFVVNGQYLFPMLFVTVACGAVSGFHSLICSGTTSKQIDNERDILPISFGAMLVEVLLAVVAIIAVGAIAVGGQIPSGTPPVIFATAISGFLATVGLPVELSYTLMTLAISAFALTSLDTISRIGRLTFSELFMNSNPEKKNTSWNKIMGNKFFATAVTLFLGFLLSLGGYLNIWSLFGSANQLLAALTLIVLAVFLKKTNKKGFMLYIPMIFMMAVTFSALSLTVLKLFEKLFITHDFIIYSDGLQLFFAVLLFGLGISVSIKGIQKLWGTKADKIQTAA
ncbi:Peptide transporter CstA [Methanosarcinaceae archaeon Ag5]|uniref:Peptide transporter CstA n=1 Tax=Methanolapillus africanus TaxID=3028297 RepID=A0AAE4MHS6_9EURY|nr:Peptide transporter CstA [Methanosarcinaceae archaeon Ag5]